MNSSDPLLGSVTSTVQKVEVNVCGVGEYTYIYSLFPIFQIYKKEGRLTESSVYPSPSL